MKAKLSRRDIEILIFLIIFGIFFWILWKNYYRIQMIFNVNVLSNITPDTFEISNKDEYNKRIHMGVKEMINSKAVFCSMLRDTEDRIPDIITRVEAMGNLFKDYRVLIVENDSKDKTRQLLLEWSKNNPKVIILGCGYNASECSLNLPKTDGHNVDRKRIEKMAALRNIYLDEIKNHYADYDYMIVWDLDILGSIYIDGLSNSFGYLTLLKNKDWDIDAMCAYGIFKTPLGHFYGDSYAHIDEGDNFHIQTKVIHDIKKRLELNNCNRGDIPIKCQSCFSGFTIYKIPSIMKAKYETSPPEDDNVICEHVGFSSYLKNVYMNPSMLFIILANNN